MDAERNPIARRILHFTLEIVSLLTREDYTIVKKTSCDRVAPSTCLRESGGWSRSRGPITEKILELIYKMTALLTGEVPIRCQDITVYLSKEEWEYLEGHKDQYKDVMMEDHRPLTSPEGSSTRNSPHLRLLYSRDLPEENPSVPKDDRVEDLMAIKVEVIDEEESDLRADPQYGLGGRNPAQRCPLYSQHSPEGPQDEDLTYVTAETEAEEERMMADQAMSDVKGEIPKDVTTDNPSENLERNFMLSLRYKVEDEDILQQTSGENLITCNVHPGLNSTDLSHNPPSPDQSQNSHKEGKRFHCGECGKQFTKSSGLYTHRRIHTGEKPYLCTECGKCFTRKSHLQQHERSHTGEKPYSCSLCGKCFIDKSTLEKHERIHTGEKPFSCSLCGKRFTDKSSLVTHERIHTGEKLFSCSLCGKCFTKKSNLVTHERSHNGEKPFPCSVCGKCFITKSNLVKHKRVHTGEKPFSCLLCGKFFTDKSSLITHQRIHRGEKPFSCSECGKCFTGKSNLITHERIHTGEKPYSCSICGKCFKDKSNLLKHKRSHTGEKPYSCSLCGKCFTGKTNLVIHERIHTGEKPYSCSLCGKCFTDKASLVIHQRIHTGEKPYSCSLCGKCFPKKSNLVKHERSHTK